MIAIVDYGVGNLQAIHNIIKKAGGKAILTSDPDTIATADKLILPGVGSFDFCAEQLDSRNLREVLNKQVIDKKKIVLGLCVGAQLMTEGSDEGLQKGLGWVSARTVKFDTARVDILPHMGWRDVQFNKPSALTTSLETEARFYFVHSYHFLFSDLSQVLGTAKYGYDFACAFQWGNIYGVQFHPEKSHRFGIQLFKNFIAL